MVIKDGIHSSTASSANMCMCQVTMNFVNNWRETPTLAGESKIGGRIPGSRILRQNVANSCGKFMAFMLSILTEDELQVLSDTAYVINFQITEPIV